MRSTSFCAWTGSKAQFLAVGLFGLLVGLPTGLFAQTGVFKNASSVAGIDHEYATANFMGGGVAWFDYDNDGDEDLYLPGGANMDALYRNNGDGTFTNVATEAGLTFTWGFATTGVVTADVDRDGDRDVFLTVLPGAVLTTSNNHLLRNNGDGTFTDVSIIAGLAGDIDWSTAAAFGDYNLDGWVDLYAANYVDPDSLAVTEDSMGVVNGFAHKCDRNWMYLNNGDGTFTEVSDLLGVGGGPSCALATTMSDYDNDHDPDIWVINDFGEFIIPNQLFQNQYPLDDYEDVSVSAGADWGMYGMGIAIGDYDHDQDLDYYTTNIGLNHLYTNNGDGTFSDGTAAAGVGDQYVQWGSPLYTVGWGTAFVDLDNDRWQDLVVSNGHMPAANFILNDIENPNRIFFNNGDGTFTENGSALGAADTGVCRGFAYADYDQDGDMDLLYANIESFYTSYPDKFILLENELNSGNNWLQLKLHGTVNNLDAYGAKVRVEVDGDIWIDEVQGGSSHGSQNSSILQIGLGSASQVDELTVIWPGGWEQSIENVPANQLLNIFEDTSSTVINQLPVLDNGIGMLVRPNPVVNGTRVAFDLPIALRQARVQVIDPSGRSVALLHDGALPSGRSILSWDGADAGGQRLVPGTYHIQLVSPEAVAVQPVLVVR
jgi:hypothetical protein